MTMILEIDDQFDPAQRVVTLAISVEEFDDVEMLFDSWTKVQKIIGESLRRRPKEIRA